MDDVEDLGPAVRDVYLDGELYQVSIMKEMRERDYPYAIRTPQDEKTPICSVVLIMDP